MPHRSPAWVWVGRLTAAVILAGLAGYLALAGPDTATTVSSAVGALVALAALVAPYLLPPPTPARPEPGSTQTVTHTVVGGHLTQAHQVPGQVDAPTATSATAPPPTPPAAGPVSDRPGQHVNGVWVGGNLTQLDGGDTDVTRE